MTVERSSQLQDSSASLAEIKTDVPTKIIVIYEFKKNVFYKPSCKMIQLNINIPNFIHSQKLIKPPYTSKIFHYNLKIFLLFHHYARKATHNERRIRKWKHQLDLPPCLYECYSEVLALLNITEQNMNITLDFSHCFIYMNIHPSSYLSLSNSPTACPISHIKFRNKCFC